MTSQKPTCFSGEAVFDDSDTMRFYVLSCVAVLLLLWAVDLFSLKSNIFAIPLLFTVFFLNPMLVWMAEKTFGEKETPNKTLVMFALIAVILVWISNPTRPLANSLAVPVALMFLLPSFFYFTRKITMGSETNVQSQ